MKNMQRKKKDKDVEILKALAHPVRLGIVKALHAKGELCACEICGLFEFWRYCVRRESLITSVRGR